MSVFTKISNFFGGLVTSSPSSQTEITDIVTGIVSSQGTNNQLNSLASNNIYQSYYQQMLGNNTYERLEKIQKESEERCKLIEEKINLFEPTTKTILSEIDSDINCFVFSSNFLNESELKLEKKFKIGNVINEHIKKLKFNNKLEGIINNDD